ncbi:MAG: T9SS type A sorting domain-containing protein [Bacteroidetes bacterium]|nr:T9SS type A sorting domain-containing protein [Bacteroidota bacterium]
MVIRLVNISGQVLYMKEIKNVKKFTENINVSEFAKGIYYLKVNAGGVSKIKEIAIVR